jgi:hypothetical protein
VTAKKQPDLKELIGKTLQSAQQDMMLTLPDRLLLAFSKKLYQKDRDADGKPFASFYRWLWTMPPAGVGLQSYPHIDVPIIIKMLEQTRDRKPLASRTTINALISDLTSGYGASRGKGGRPKKEEKNRNGAVAVNGVSSRKKSSSSTALAARLAESDDPKVKRAWEEHLAGKRSVTGAAIACGLIKDNHTPLSRLKQYWRNATPQEREMFLEWARQDVE